MKTLTAKQAFLNSRQDLSPVTIKWYDRTLTRFAEFYPKLPRLKLEWHPIRLRSDLNYIPNVIVLWGSRGASVRIFTNYLVAV